MTIQINEELQERLQEQAETLGVSVEELVNNILITSADFMFTLGRIEYLLDTQVLTRLADIGTNVYAARHQIMNFHADASETSSRAIAISNEATEIGLKAVYDDNKKEENDEDENS